MPGSKKNEAETNVIKLELEITTGNESFSLTNEFQLKRSSPNDSNIKNEMKKQ